MTARDGLAFRIDSRGVASVCLDRPAEANALDMPLALAFAAAVDTISASSEVKVVHLAATGKIFCGGGDVRAMASSPDRGAYLSELAGTVHRALIALDELPRPVVATVSGAVAGAGLGLVLAADHVVATPTSSYVAAYSGVGLSPDCGVSINLPRAVGLRRALRMVMQNERIDAETALDWGLIDQLVDLAELDSTIDDVITRLLDRPVAATGDARRLVRASYGRTFAQHLVDEAATIGQRGVSADATALLARYAD